MVCAMYSLAARLLTHSRILSATIRDNILFSLAYDETFYNLVIEGAHFWYSTWMFTHNDAQLVR